MIPRGGPCYRPAEASRLSTRTGQDLISLVSPNTRYASTKWLHPIAGYGWAVDWPHRQLLDIGNRVVCARVMGQGPTVVLEAGGAGERTTEAYGGLLEEQLAAFATVLTYDRAGSGRSDGPPHRSVAQMADDLDAVIRLFGCATPVVIVGWSAGGLVAEMFAARYPDKVAGLVLLDPSETTYVPAGRISWAGP